MKTRFKLDEYGRLVPCYKYPKCKCTGHCVWEKVKQEKSGSSGE